MPSWKRRPRSATVATMPPDAKRPAPRARRPLGLAGGDGLPQANRNPDKIQAHWQRLGDVTTRIVERLRRFGEGRPIHEVSS